MIDIQLLIKDPYLFQENCRKRGVDLDVNQVVQAYQNRNQKLREAQAMRQEQNEVASCMKSKDLEADKRQALIAKGRDLKARLIEAEADLEILEKEFYQLAIKLPNLTHPQSPEGGEADFRVVREWREPTRFSFDPMDHLQLAQRHDLIDFEMGATVTGQKFYFLKNEAVFLELALMQYALNVAARHGFKPVMTPDLAKNSILEGIGFNPRGPESQVYRLDEHDLSLIGTAEITIGGSYADHIFDVSQLPLLVAGISHCFRTEAGSGGRESKGLYRVHQFSKVELFAFCSPDDSEAMHDRILAIEEEIFQGLELPYRVIDIASGDLGAPAYRKFDIEAWMPGRGAHGSYGEVTSTSNCLDFQSRRLKIRYRSPNSDKPELVHTLNGTAVANSRAIVALLENGQQADGSILLPKALHPYLPFKKIG